MSIHRTIVTDACIDIFNPSESDILRMDFTAISLTKLQYRAIAPHAENSRDKAATKVENSLDNLNILPLRSSPW